MNAYEEAKMKTGPNFEDLVIIKNTTNGNCFVTNAKEVSFVRDNGEVDDDLKITIVETGRYEFFESGTTALTFTRRDTIPRNFLASTTHEDVKAMCMKTTFWANQSASGSLGITRTHRQRRDCYIQSYPCGCTCYERVCSV
ncbi:hypothetical protein HOLleu_15300 [Holothuria leucospilota]|uniref:Uncharacterized protein n=1 Tax=Holothuria leucospilota TaxID=206669 RepID=A0A9Q1H9I6_HOLLE|nr:hypothetical protein HOLleu_15300 [Holothuria leucospilota]